MRGGRLIACDRRPALTVVACGEGPESHLLERRLIAGGHHLPCIQSHHMPAGPARDAHLVTSCGMAAGCRHKPKSRKASHKAMHLSQKPMQLHAGLGIERHHSVRAPWSSAGHAHTAQHSQLNACVECESGTEQGGTLNCHVIRLRQWQQVRHNKRQRYFSHAVALREPT